MIYFFGKFVGQSNADHCMYYLLHSHLYVFILQHMSLCCHTHAFLTVALSYACICTVTCSHACLYTFTLSYGTLYISCVRCCVHFLSSRHVLYGTQYNYPLSKYVFSTTRGTCALFFGSMHLQSL